MPEELAGFEQCFLTGTAAEVTPVAEIGQYKFAIGDITRNLMDDFTALVHRTRRSPPQARALAPEPRYGRVHRLAHEYSEQ